MSFSFTLLIVKLLSVLGHSTLINRDAQQRLQEDMENIAKSIGGEVFNPDANLGSRHEPNEEEPKAQDMTSAIESEGATTTATESSMSAPRLSPRMSPRAVAAAAATGQPVAITGVCDVSMDTVSKTGEEGKSSPRRVVDQRSPRANTIKDSGNGPDAAAAVYPIESAVSSNQIS